MSRVRHAALLSLSMFLASSASAQQGFRPRSWSLIQDGKFRDALDRLVQSAAASPGDPKVYATLSLLYTKIGECGLAWKYFRITQDLGSKETDLDKDVRSLCQEPREEKREEILRVERSDKGTLLTIQFSPEQQQWPYRAKLAIFRPTEGRTYCELTNTQVRRVRKLTGRTLPWLVLDTRKGWTAVVRSGDGWWTVVTELP